MTLLISMALLALGLAVLVKSSDFFIGAAERIGVGFGLSPFVIGVTIVALGTSFPELASAIASVLMGASEIAVGTAVGSNITNILLILSVAAVASRGFRVDYELVRVDLPFLFGSSLLLALCAYSGSVGRLEGFLCLSAIGCYLVYANTTSDQHPGTVATAGSEVAASFATEFEVTPVQPGARTWAVLAGSALGLQGGAYLTVETATRIAAAMGIGNEIIAATVLALGTSLPELSVSLRAARENKAELAVGNVIGSNIFNALGVIGAAAVFGALSVPPVLLGFGIPVMLGVTILCFFVLQEGEMTRWDGWLLLVLYVAYTTQFFEAA